MNHGSAWLQEAASLKRVTGKPFWEQPLWRWDSMFTAQQEYEHTTKRANSPRRRWLPRRGLILNISSWAVQKQIANIAYEVSKAATDKMTAEMAVELRPMELRSCRCIRDWFGRRRFGSGCADPDVIRHTGTVLVAANVAEKYGFTDIDGKTPRPLTRTDV